MEASVKKPVIVRKVFGEELEREFRMISSAILRFPLVSMDTEFPGTIFKADKKIVSQGNPIINYHYMKSNVDALKIVQLGLTLSDYQGNLPDFGTPFSYIWEFNFKDFDIDKDRYDCDSIELLKRQGIDFEKNKEEGIDSKKFAIMLWNSGLIFNSHGLRKTTWITFHSAYDFGFMVKMLTQRPLPVDLQTFMSKLIYFFGHNVFDLKQTFRCLGLPGSLEKVAKKLNVIRAVGLSHQAGSDTLLILHCFMKINNSKVFECNQRNRLLPALALFGLVQVIE